MRASGLGILPLWAAVVVVVDGHHLVVFDIHAMVFAHGLDGGDEVCRDLGCESHEEVVLVRDLAALSS